ncbi:MAG: hypothetical protein V4651_11940 [Bacteroidota bacterium]
MKRTIFKTTFLLLSLVSLIALSSCEKDNPPGGGGGGGNDPDVSLCTTYGTFTRIVCGASIYDNYWIRTDDGRYLQPCETDIKTLCPLPITEGTRIKFGYKKIYGKSSCDDIVTCLAYDSRMAGSTKVRVTCLEIISQPNTTDCKIMGTVVYNESCKLKTIMGDDGIEIEPVNQDELANYKNGARVLYGYSPVCTLAFSVTCTKAMGAMVTCIRPIMIK